MRTVAPCRAEEFGVEMYPRSFHYHRAASLQEASTMLAQLGDEAKVLAGGQSLIPLMKLRFANPRHLVDLNFVPGAGYIKENGEEVRFGTLTGMLKLRIPQSLLAFRFFTIARLGLLTCRSAIAAPSAAPWPRRIPAETGRRCC